MGLSFLFFRRSFYQTNIYVWHMKGAYRWKELTFHQSKFGPLAFNRSRSLFFCRQCVTNFHKYVAEFFWATRNIAQLSGNVMARQICYPTETPNCAFEIWRQSYFGIFRAFCEN